MLKEYVIEPDVLYRATETKRNLKNFTSEFKIGCSRVISEYPQFKRFRSNILTGKPSGFSDSQNERLTALLSLLGDLPKVKRASAYDKSMPWEDNILSACKDVDFDYVVTVVSNPVLGAKLILLESVLCGEPEYKRQLPVRRIASEMSAALSDMLRISSKVVFVDPFFSDKPRMWDPLLEFIRKATTNKPTDNVEFVVLYDGNKKNSPTPDYLTTKFEREQLSLLPTGSKLTFKSIKEKEAGGEKLHNRYVITDVGAVFFGIGLDEDTDNPDHTDDVSLLDAELYEKRHSQYVELNAFIEINSETVQPND